MVSNFVLTLTRAKLLTICNQTPSKFLIYNTILVRNSNITLLLNTLVSLCVTCKAFSPAILTGLCCQASECKQSTAILDSLVAYLNFHPLTIEFSEHLNKTILLHCNIFPSNFCCISSCPICPPVHPSSLSGVHTISHV